MPHSCVFSFILHRTANREQPYTTYDLTDILGKGIFRGNAHMPLLSSPIANYANTSAVRACKHVSILLISINNDKPAAAAAALPPSARKRLEIIKRAETRRHGAKTRKCAAGKKARLKAISRTRASERASMCVCERASEGCTQEVKCIGSSRATRIFLPPRIERFSFFAAFCFPEPVPGPR